MMTFEDRLKDLRDVIESAHDMCGDMHGDIETTGEVGGKKVLNHLGAARSMTLLDIGKALQLAYDLAGLAASLESYIADAKDDPEALEHMSMAAGVAALSVFGPRMFGAHGFEEATGDK
jgi:hypothetical protein